MSLEIRNLTFSYKKILLCQKDAEHENMVLAEFSACFESGQITAVTGDNGSGKTTLAKAIMGVIRPDDGSIYVDGQCIDDWSLAERGRIIGYVMQNPDRQIFNDTVLEEVMFGLINQGMKIYQAEKTAREYIEMFDLCHHINDFPFNLSHGEKQRLVLAAILAMKPEYIILDEPTASLDQKHKEILGKMLRRIAQIKMYGLQTGEKEYKGCGVILISHDRKFVEEYCDEEIKLHG